MIAGQADQGRKPYQMRSSKSRSRSKQNRPRTLGNIINRVFDSSGPEGKVRGTPQQIIEKYQLLARDAQLSNDRVAAENFLQHAEHYTRMLAEAQREMNAEQEARRQQQGQNGQQGGQQGNQWRDRNTQQGTRDDQPDDSPGGFDLVDPEGGNLVETPETLPEPAPQREQRDQQNRDHQRPPRDNRRPQFQRPPRERAEDRPQEIAPQPVGAEPDPVAPVVAPEPQAEAPARKPQSRGPRKPKPSAEADKPEAAE